MKNLYFSKPITYALTLEELGTEIVHRYQGREPSGRMFNEIVLDHNSKNPSILSYFKLLYQQIHAASKDVHLCI